MIILKAKYTDGRGFLRHYQNNFPGGGVFIPTRKKYELGSSVVVDVRFPELRSKVLVRGIIAWRRAGKRRTKLRAGVGVEFLTAENKKRDFLLGVAEGQIVDLTQRRHRRLPVEIRVDWREKSDRSWHIASVEDIGEGGAFIRTTDFLPVRLESKVFEIHLRLGDDLLVKGTTRLPTDAPCSGTETHRKIRRQEFHQAFDRE